MVILDRLLRDLQDACLAFPDKRKGEGEYTMADIGLSAFSLFFMQFFAVLHAVGFVSFLSTLA